MAVSVDSIQAELQKMGSEDREVRVSVSQLKQKLGVGAGVRLVIEPDAKEPVLEPVLETSAPPAPRTTAAPVSLPAATEQLVEAAPLPPPTANNVFMKRNIKVREWASFSGSGSTPERKTSSDELPPLWEKEESPAEAPEARKDGKARPAQHELMAKEAAAVDTLKKKLEMKKALSQEEARVSPRWGTGVDILSTGGPWRGQQRRANTEVFGQTVKEEAVQDASNGTVASTGGMVTVTPNRTPKARISMSSMDRGREDFINQFSERTRPISEASPIKAELESIYNNGQVSKSPVGSASPPVAETPTAPPAVADTTGEGADGKEIVFTTEEEEQAKKAAVKAMEAAFAKKKKRAEEEEKAKKEAEEDSAEDPPVPVQRTSIKKKTEYIAVRPSTGETKPSIKIGDFSSSATDYTSLSKPNPQQPALPATSSTNSTPIQPPRTFPRVSEERSAHDLEYPDIPSIPEEQEEDVLSTPSRSPVIFSEFDPDSGGGGGGLHSRERRDGAGEERVAAMPWQGILRKAHRAGMNTN